MRKYDPTRDEPETIADVICMRETDKALLCTIDGAEVWIPKSQLLAGNEVDARGCQGDLVIPRWLAIEKQLVDEDDEA